MNLYNNLNEQYLLFLEMNNNPQGTAIYYHIVPDQKIVSFVRIDPTKMYENMGGGFVRKAIMAHKKTSISSDVDCFTDRNFVIPQSSQYRLARLYDLYKTETILFPQNQKHSSWIRPHKIYNTFLAESGLISFDYLRTLFITQFVNKLGYYQYFVKRAGEYYLEECDDIIPVDKMTGMPLWDLKTEHPWQILLLKVWIKECGSVENLYKAKPFRFLQAFGLSTYQVFNFRKQINFLRKQKLPLEKKKQNQNFFPMNKIDVIILAKTISDPKVQKIGLIPNITAYRCLRITKKDQIGIHRVFSTLPCNWVGSYSPVLNTNLNKVYNIEMFLDLQRNFLMTEQQIFTYFNKFYVVPYQLCEPDRIVTQDCINLVVQKMKPVWLSFQVKSPEGLLSISFQLPKVKNSQGKYPEFRYFLSKSRNQEEVTRSHYRSDVRGSERDGNMYIESNCDKWDCFTVQYMQGYHNSSTFFCRAVQGFYVLYLDMEYDGPVNIRFDAHLTITKPQIYLPDAVQAKQIFDSTFFSVSQDMGIQASLNSDLFEQSISLNNSFEELGFGSISVRTLTKAKHRVAMRVFPDKLKQAGFRLLSHYNELQQDPNRQKNFVLISSKGRPQIIVMQKIQNRSQSTLGSVFPPPGTVQFFRLEPLVNYKYK